MKPIYLERDETALKAEKECNTIAQEKGFSSWWDWYHTELENKDLDLYRRSSYKAMMDVTNKYSQVG